ncbi:kinase domain protein, partial [Onchocerca flexuosa]
QRPLLYELRIRAFSTISGAILLTESGALHDFNEHFIEALIGKRKKEALKDIVEFNYMLISGCSSSASAQNNHSSVTWQINDLAISLQKMEPLENVSIGSSHSSVSEIYSSMPSTSSQCSNVQSWNQMIVDEEKTNNQNTSIMEGSFHGFAKHSDGNLIAVCFNIKRLEPSNGANWAVFISYNRISDSSFSDNMKEVESIEENICDNDNDSICAYNDDDYQFDFKVEKNQVESSQLSEDENVQEIAGEYSEYYETHHLIGNGAFGSVKLTTRKDSGILAVAKFICKSKVFSESWIPSSKRGNRVVPIELHLLETLSHPNIVKLLDVFENDTYYQLVMEKLGCGMDLFEFIEQEPKLDEPLISYIFRQLFILLIRRLLSTLLTLINLFRYRGPELEMWSLGILLYTLVFFENPFRSLQEAMHAEIELPWEVSEGLFQVIAWLLQRDPQLRATIRNISNHYWVKQSVDLRKYRFQDVLKKYDHPQFDRSNCASELVNHFKNTSDYYSLSLGIDATSSESKVEIL